TENPTVRKLTYSKGRGNFYAAFILARNRSPDSPDSQHRYAASIFRPRHARAATARTLPGRHRLYVPKSPTASGRTDPHLRGEHPRGVERENGVPRRQRVGVDHLRATVRQVPRLPGRGSDQSEV